MFYSDGRTYKGGFINDQKNGQGNFTWPDGRVYRGGWLNDKKEG